MLIQGHVSGDGWGLTPQRMLFLWPRAAPLALPFPRDQGLSTKSGVSPFPSSGPWNSTAHPLWLFAKTEPLSSLSCTGHGWTDWLSYSSTWLPCAVPTTPGHRAVSLEIPALPFSVKTTYFPRTAGISELRAGPPFSYERKRPLMFSSGPCC